MKKGPEGLKVTKHLHRTAECGSAQQPCFGAMGVQGVDLEAPWGPVGGGEGGNTGTGWSRPSLGRMEGPGLASCPEV